MLCMLIGPIKISKCPLWGFRSSFVRLVVQGSILDFVTAKKKKKPNVKFYGVKVIIKW